MLETHELSVNFGGHLAINQISCQFRPNELTAIVGPNGAGKTTYFNLISGQVKATQGKITLHGVDLHPLNVVQRMHQGLGRGFQLTQLFPELTVHENIRLSVQSKFQGSSWLNINIWRRWDHQTAWLRRADDILAMTQLESVATQQAGRLSHGDQRKLEIAMLVALQPKVYMFDEPTAGMSVDDAPKILEIIRQIKADPNNIIMLVEHKMDVLHALADRVIVLHQGELVAEGEPAEIMASEIVQSCYLGQRIQRRYNDDGSE